MKDKLTRNIGLKILSIVLAAILWLIITNVDDPVVPLDFRNVQVNVLNEDAIVSPTRDYEILSGKTVDFTVRARRSISDELTEDDFAVTADLSMLSDLNVVDIDITCPPEVTLTSVKNSKMKISIEEIRYKTIKVDVVTKGEVAEDYFIHEAIASPNMILVTGPQTKVDQIRKVVVEVDVENASKSLNRIVRPKVYDEEGEEIDTSRLEFDDNSVYVSVGLYKKKAIDLLIKTTGEPALGYEVSKIDYDPKRIEIAAEDMILNNVKNTITVYEDITGISSNIEKNLDLEAALENMPPVDALPPGVILVGDTSVALTIELEKLETKEITIWPIDIDTKFKDPSLNVYFNTSGPINVKVMGKEDELKDLTRQSFKPYIDLSGYSAGTYALQLKTDYSNDVVIYDTKMINVNLRNY